MAEFKELNTEAVLELREAGIFTPDNNTFMEKWTYMLMFAAMWLLMVAPSAMDITLLVYYSMYDFGSSVEVYVEEHWTGWTVYAIAQGGLAVIVAGYYAYLGLVLTSQMMGDDFVGENSVVNDDYYFWGFIATNSA